MPRERRRSAVHEPEYRYLIGRLRDARKEAGMTQLDVGRALGRASSFMSKVELGERRIDPIDLRNFAELFEKPLEYFYPPRPARRQKPR